MFSQTQRTIVFALGLVTTAVVVVGMWVWPSHEKLREPRFDSTRELQQFSVATSATASDPAVTPEMLKEYGIPTGPVTFPDDPFDTFYSHFENKGEMPPAMEIRSSEPHAREELETLAIAHVWSRQIRLASRRLKRREFKVSELNKEEQRLCVQLFNAAACGFKSQRDAEAGEKLPITATVRLYKSEQGHECVEINTGKQNVGFNAVLF